MKKLLLLAAVLFSVTLCAEDQFVRRTLNNNNISFELMKNGDFVIRDSGITVFIDSNVTTYENLSVRNIFAVPAYNGTITDRIKVNMLNANGDLKFGCWLMLTDRYCAYRVQLKADCSEAQLMTAIVFAFSAAQKFEQDVVNK